MVDPVNGEPLSASPRERIDRFRDRVDVV